MTTSNQFNAFAASRGEGLHPKLRDLLERVAASPFSEVSIGHNGMLQAGPNPASETVALHQTSPTSSFDHILATLNEFAFDRGPMAGKISQLQGGMTCPASSFQSRTAD